QAVAAHQRPGVGVASSRNIGGRQLRGAACANHRSRSSQHRRGHHGDAHRGRGKRAAARIRDREAVHRVLGWGYAERGRIGGSGQAIAAHQRPGVGGREARQVGSAEYGRAAGASQRRRRNDGRRRVHVDVYRRRRGAAAARKAVAAHQRPGIGVGSGRAREGYIVDSPEVAPVIRIMPAQLHAGLVEVAGQVDGRGSRRIDVAGISGNCRPGGAAVGRDFHGPAARIQNQKLLEGDAQSRIAYCAENRRSKRGVGGRIWPARI
nr:hypothetical protein [Tanacetum cinerariifolium]